MHVLAVPSASKWAAPGFWFATEPKLPRDDATDGPRSPRAASAWICGATRLPRGIPPPSATGDGVTPCETKRVQLFPNSPNLPCCFRRCQWKWSGHLWGRTDVIGSHPQTAGNYVRLDLIGFCCCIVLISCVWRDSVFVFLSQGLQSGGGHAPILAPGCPNTGGLARVQEITITTRHTLAPRSAATGTRSASDGRKAFHRRGARASAVRLVIRLLNDVFIVSSFAFVSCDFPSHVFCQFAVRLCGWVSWTRGRSSKMWPVYWRSLVRSSPSM